jgi:hypothetical protein
MPACADGPEFACSWEGEDADTADAADAVFTNSPHEAWMEGSLVIQRRHLSAGRKCFDCNAERSSKFSSVGRRVTESTDSRKEAPCNIAARR